jgi:hypothetical protein
MNRALWVCGLCGFVSAGCSSSTGPGDTAGADGAAAGGAEGGGPSGGADGGGGGSSGGAATGGTSLTGTWDLVTTQDGTSGAVPTTVAIGQDSLTVTSPEFTLTAVRTGQTLTFTDEDSPGDPGNNVALTAIQTAASFNAGILPFDLGGSWAMQIVPAGGSPVMTCTLTVSSTEIDGACQKVTDDGFDLNFTTKKMTSAASSLGDFGGTWMNNWEGTGGVYYPCELDFIGNSITTCPGQVKDGEITGSPLTGITFTYDGANTASGAAQGWAEYSATRR